MSDRIRLRCRRGGQNLSFQVPGRLGKGPMDFTALLGYAPGGSLAEVFFHCGKAGTDMNVLLHEMGLAFSFALQYGCPPLAMQKAMPRTAEGEAEGPLGTLLDLLTAQDIHDAEKELLT